MAKEVNLPEVLDKYAHGGKVSVKDGQAAVAAAAGLRHEFLRDAFQALQEVDPASQEFKAFTQCIRSMGETLVRHGIVSASEMQKLWMGIEMVS